MKVSEIFYSIQGEGTNIGVPSVFLRLAVCNLQCSWCDSRYTWDWERYDYNKEVKEMNVSKVCERIQEYDCRHLVITGGEPMLQQSELASLLPPLQQCGFDFEIETNGTIVPTEPLVNSIGQWNVSPKTSNSENSVDCRERSEAYAYFRKLPNAYFKYVVSSDEDLNEIMNLIAKYQIPRSRVILMPEASSEHELLEKNAWLSAICKINGFRFTTRLQIILYGNKRGT